MRIHIIKTFQSRVLGLCRAGDDITCDDAIGASIIASKLGVQVTGDQPVEQKKKRRSKKINERTIETGALKFETVSD